jgi:hypothetical protein
MKKIGLIGYGKWGKILYDKLKIFCDIKFICRSKDSYLDKLDQIDWVVIATPEDTHYEIVKNCLSNGKNVFCEKPLTPTYKQSCQLFDIAEQHKVKLYVDDVQNFRIVDYKLEQNNFVERKKNSKNSTPLDLFFKLAYHDFYFLYEHIKNKKIKDVEILNTTKNLNFKVLYDNFNIEFLYDVYFDGKEHNINSVSIDGKDDIVLKMLQKVFNEDVDFDYNKKISLFANKYIETIINYCR